jgi:hypothetical protein
MIKPVLPPCSVVGCKRAAGAIINEVLLCAEHAIIEYAKVLEERRRLRECNSGEEASNR